MIVIGGGVVGCAITRRFALAGAKPLAMIEENPRITTYRSAVLFARLMGVPIYYNAKISDIGDIAETRQIEIENAKGERQTIACDGVIFSCKFVGDKNLARASHLALNPST